MKKVIISLLAISLFYGCPIDNNNVEGVFSDTPVNMTAFNTEYDDYNSAAPFTTESFPLCFSTNRNSHGEQFDIIYKLVTIYRDREKKDMELMDETNTPNDFIIERYQPLKKAVEKIRVTANEFGPYIIPFSNENLFNFEYNDEIYFKYLMLYADDQSGNLDIKFTENYNDSLKFSAPAPVSFLNTEFDDAYPCFNSDFSQLFFCSDRTGEFNIFSVDFDNSIDLITGLKGTIDLDIQKEEILSSEGDDKCPYIEKTLMVFASNRSGGFGGYDLYYSKFENGEWSAPVNFGDKINTEYDEFRPIVKSVFEFTNDFMIFSSNRSGGKGGYDLYYVGIDKI